MYSAFTEAISDATTVEPAIGLEPMTCTLRVRFLKISTNPWSPQSLQTAPKPRLLKRMGCARTLRASVPKGHQWPVMPNLAKRLIGDGSPKGNGWATGPAVRPVQSN